MPWPILGDRIEGHLLIDATIQRMTAVAGWVIYMFIGCVYILNSFSITWSANVDCACGVISTSDATWTHLMVSDPFRFVMCRFTGGHSRISQAFVFVAGEEKDDRVVSTYSKDHYFRGLRIDVH